MGQAYISNIETDGEVRRFKDHGQAVVSSAGGAAFMRGTFEPGWRWSKDVAPIAGTESCLTRHLGFVESGAMHIRADDGSEFEIGPGDLFDLPAGHDAWVIGDEPCVMIDVSPETTRYATGGAAAPQAEDRYLALVRRGYAAFNSGDIEGLVALLAHDVIQHVPGNNATSGEHKGLEATLGYYAKLGELTGGTFRAHLLDVHGDGRGHVVAHHQTTATRNGVTRVSRGSIVFTFVGDKVIDMLELHADLAGDDAFLS